GILVPAVKDLPRIVSSVFNGLVNKSACVGCNVKPASITALVATSAACHFVKSFDGLFKGLATYNNILAFKAIAASLVSLPEAGETPSNSVMAKLHSSNTNVAHSS